MWMMAMLARALGFAADPQASQVTQKLGSRTLDWSCDRLSQRLRTRHSGSLTVSQADVWITAEGRAGDWIVPRGGTLRVPAGEALWISSWRGGDAGLSWHSDATDSHGWLTALLHRRRADAAAAELCMHS